MSNEPAKWEVKQKITGTGDTAKTLNQLVCDGKIVHEGGGPTAYDSLRKYAEKMNLEKKPAPEPKTKIGADGYSFKTPAKKTGESKKTVIPSMAEWAKKHGIV